MKNKSFNIIFFLRMFNDHDHMAPIIEEFLENGHNVKLLTLNHRVNNNYILEYLKSKYGIRVEIITHKNSLLSYLIIFFQKKLSDVFFQNFFFERIKGRVLTILNRKILNYGQKNSELAIEYINTISPDVIIVDRTNLNNNRYYRVFSALSSKKVPIVRMTHGIPTSITTPVKANLELAKENCIIPDYDVWTGINEREAYEHISGLISPNNPILGSLRFSKRWMDNYPNLLLHCKTKDKILKKDGVINILVIMEAGYKINVTNATNLIKKILCLNDVFVHIKPHTRDRVKSVKSLINMQSKYKNLHINRENTVYLMNQCQLILYFSSSVAIHGYLNGCNMINLAHLCNYKTIFSDYGLGCDCRSDDEVIDLIDKYKNNKVLGCYNERSWNRFFDDTIGVRTVDAIQTTYKFIFDIIQKKNLSK